MKTFLVGGAVRDKLLGLPVKDRDWVVVGATPAMLREQGYRQVGRDFPVFIDPQSGEEYALARTERKRGRGYTGFEVHASPEVTLEEDLERRDLTINAMAEDPDGKLIDPFGGRQDLQQRRLRHVSPAFTEDPLRVLRVARFGARFAGLGFTLADETLALMWRIAARGELRDLVPERLWQETQRALLEDRPARYIEILRHCGALQHVFPEIRQLFGVPQCPENHPEIDSGLHTLLVLDQAAGLSSALPVRFAALCHDLGKALTPVRDWPHHPGHAERGIPLLEALAERLRVPNDCRDLARLVMRHHGESHGSLEAGPEALLNLLEQCDAFRKPERFQKFLLACEADHRGRTGFEETPYPQAAHLQRALSVCQSISSREIVAAGFQGPAVGQELRQQRLAALNGRSD